MPHRLNKPQIAVVWVVVGLAGVAAGWHGQRSARDRLVGALTDEAQRCAAAFEAVELHQLAGLPADVDRQVYRMV